ncbi:MAG: hypothetical protein ACI9UN_002152 [Granulosicoccus sp.]|jgi:hypothetical protein
MHHKYTTAKFDPKNTNFFTGFDLNSGNYLLGVSLESIVPYGKNPLCTESVIFHNGEPFSNISSLTSFDGLTLDYQLSNLNGAPLAPVPLPLSSILFVLELIGLLLPAKGFAWRFTGE